MTYIFLLFPTPLLLYPFPPLPYLFHPSYLSSVLAQYFSPFLFLPLSHFTASSPHMLDRLSLLTAHPAHSFLLLHPVPVLSLLVPTSKSRHHFPFFRALSPQIHRNILCHAPLILPVVPRFSDSLYSLLLVRISVPLAQLSTHPSSFRSHSFHFLTGIPVPPAVLLSLLLIRVLNLIK
jgi:hypothetical protein